MERDNFDEILRNIVSKSDQEISKDHGKERVWNAVKRGQPQKKWWWIAAVTVMALLIIGLYPKSKTENLPLGRSKESMEKQKDLPLATELQKNEIIVRDNNLIVKQQQKPAYTNVIEITTDTSLLIGKVDEPLNIVSEPPVTAAAPQIQEHGKTVEIKSKEPEFTVQFKRGRSIETEAEKQAKAATAIRRMKFGRDTSVFASAETRSNHPFKIKF